MLEHGDYRAPIVEHCDYLVVGSGPGGAIVAHELARSGAKVVVLEAGPRLPPEKFHGDMGKTLADWFWEGGTRTTFGNVVMATLQPRCLGGGSVFNSMICMRALPSSLERWADENGLEGLGAGDLAPHYDAVESFMGVRPVAPHLQGRRNELFRQGCLALGWSAEPIRRNESGCQGSGQCMSGCRHGGKNSADRRGIAEVVALGGKVYTSVVVDRLVVRNGRVTGAFGHAEDPATRARGVDVRVTARCTIVAAGAINTPVILRNSGITADPVGANLRMHPSGFHVGVFDEKVLPWTGATQGYHSTQFLEEGIKLEALWASPAILAIRFPGIGKQLKRQLAQYDDMATWATWVSGDDSTGRVRALPNGRAHVTYDLGKADVRRLQEANAKLAELFFAAGAKQVVTGLRGVPSILESMDDVRLIRDAAFEPTDIPTASNHVFGGMCMGGDPRRSATDAWGKVWGTEDLYVADTGLFPSSPGVNPMLTAMALAHRLGQELPTRYPKAVAARAAAAPEAILGK